MKNTLVAFAAMAAFGSASAEVTWYGQLDLGMLNSTKTNSPDQGLQFTGNVYRPSLVGVYGSADLTNGVTAIFKLEQAFSLGDGSDKANNLTFNRVAMAGLQGGFGTVSGGLQWSLYDKAWGWDTLTYNNFSAPGVVFYKGLHGDNGDGSLFTSGVGFGNVKNSIKYTTPDINGFNASILYSNDANATATTSATHYLGVGANYVAGPLNVNFAYESVPSSIHLTPNPVKGITAAQGDLSSAYILGASYDFGTVKIGAAYEQASIDANGSGPAVTGGKDIGYAFCIAVPLNTQTTFAMNYASETSTVSGTTPLADGNSKGYGAQLTYAWTPNLTIYGGTIQTKTTPVASTVETTVTKYATGFVYKF